MKFTLDSGIRAHTGKYVIDEGINPQTDARRLAIMIAFALAFAVIAAGAVLRNAYQSVPSTVVGSASKTKAHSSDVSPAATTAAQTPPSPTNPVVVAPSNPAQVTPLKVKSAAPAVSAATPSAPSPSLSQPVSSSPTGSSGTGNTTTAPPAETILPPVDPVLDPVVDLVVTPAN